MLMAVGMGLTMAPATESIMGSLPLAKAGVGSAVNDTTRQVGGALGVAIIGSVLASTYGSKVGDAVAGQHLPAGVAQRRKELARLRAPDRQPDRWAGWNALASTARTAFVDGMHQGYLVGAAAPVLGAITAAIWLPARAAAGRGARGRIRSRAGRGRAGDGAVMTPAEAVARRSGGRERRGRPGDPPRGGELFGEHGFEGLSVDEVAARRAPGQRSTC